MTSLSKEAALVHAALEERGLETLRGEVLDRETRKRRIKEHMTEIMQLLNLDLSDDSPAETPHRIAKMYVDEIFSGLDYANFPKITVIENKMKVDEMVTVRDITLTSTCEHHFVTIDGKATGLYPERLGDRPVEDQPHRAVLLPASAGARAPDPTDPGGAADSARHQ